jgi:hypothetical protein
VISVISGHLGWNLTLIIEEPSGENQNVGEILELEQK